MQNTPPLRAVMRILIVTVWAFGITHSPALSADDKLQAIKNFREYSASFASSGQPSAAQLQAVRDAGFTRVVYIAFSDHDNSLPNEDRIVKKLGLEYAHIPVDWDAPQPRDFAAFAALMQRSPQQKTLLHCQVNFRASAFALLYRVLYLDVPLARAKADMDAVWTPTPTWTEFVRNVLQANGVAPDCADCNWDYEHT